MEGVNDQTHIFLYSLICDCVNSWHRLKIFVALVVFLTKTSTAVIPEGSQLVLLSLFCFLLCWYLQKTSWTNIHCPKGYIISFLHRGYLIPLKWLKNRIALATSKFYDRNYCFCWPSQSKKYFSNQNTLELVRLYSASSVKLFHRNL